MLKGFNVQEPQRAVAIDRDQLQPHFDVNRFGKDAPVRVRKESTLERYVAPASSQRDADWLLSLVSDMLLSRDALSCLKAAGDGLRHDWDASYVVVANSSQGIDVAEVMPVGLPAMAEWIDLRDTMHAALLETMLTGRVHYGVLSNSLDDRASTVCGYAVRQFANQLHGCASFASIPLFTSDGRCKGSLFVAWSRPEEVSRHRDWLDNPSRLSSIADVMEAKIQPKQRLTENIARHLKKRLPVRRTLWLSLSLLGIIAAGMLPTAYPVRAKVHVEPDQIRWISAPFDAPLKTSYVVPGDHVTVGQPLFSLDCRDLLNKLAALRADANKHASERTTHLSTGRLGDAAISTANLKRVESEIELIHRYLDRAEMRSPVDGVVMGEDMKRYEGSVLKQGQGLIEIAPLSSLHLRAEIPTDQIAHVVTGNSVTASIDSVGKLDACKLTRVHPRAEANDQGRYVFEGRIDFAGDEIALIPGMSGYATLHGQPKPLAWCWFQQLWQRVQAWSQST